MNAQVVQFPEQPLRPVQAETLNLTAPELVEASGGYVRGADQLRALHARGFSRAWRGAGGQVILERAHYVAVRNGTFGKPPPIPTRRQLCAADYRRMQEESKAALEAALAAAWLRDAPERAERARREADCAIQRAENRAALVRFHVAKRRAARLRRTPSWADMDAIRSFYDEARRLTIETGVEHHVDHDIPLQGKLVSGLHVHNNLQILTGSENSRKKNRFEVDA